MERDLVTYARSGSFEEAAGRLASEVFEAEEAYIVLQKVIAISHSHSHFY